MTRAVALILVGLWLGVLFASWAMGGASFRTAEVVAGASPGPPAGGRVALVPSDTRRPVFRHLASEINRWMFGRFGWAQLALALAVTVLAARPLAPDVGRRFSLLHGGYVVLDLVKAAVLVALAVIVARRAG